MVHKICIWPRIGMAFHASNGPIAESCAKETLKVGESMPSKWSPLMWTWVANKDAVELELGTYLKFRTQPERNNLDISKKWTLLHFGKIPRKFGQHLAEFSKILGIKIEFCNSIKNQQNLNLIFSDF